jgi:uncharacterized protein (TIGR00297 family)
LAAFFFSSSRATKYRQDIKKKIEKDFKEGGQRNYIQVLCNGGVGSLFAFVYLLEIGVGELPVNFEKHYYASLLNIAIMASYACVNADTWASELGILSKSDPVLITTLKRVPRGTNGGISLFGLVVSFLGGIFIGLFHYVSTIIFVDRDEMIDNKYPQFPIIFLGGIAGLYGSLIDSFLGATCQFSGQTPEGFIVEDIEERVVKISGRKILNNHLVNLFSCFITAITIPIIAELYWNFFTF